MSRWAFSSCTYSLILDTRRQRSFFKRVVSLWNRGLYARDEKSIRYIRCRPNKTFNTWCFSLPIYASKSKIVKHYTGSSLMETFAIEVVVCSLICTQLRLDKKLYVVHLIGVISFEVQVQGICCWTI